MQQLEKQLNNIHSETEEAIRYSEKAIKILIPTLEKLKTQLLKHSFSNKEDEIHFFKIIKPTFTAKLIYYNELYNIETNKPFGPNKSIRKYYNTELLKLETYFHENLEFYKYYRTGNQSLDKKYFIRGKHDIKFTLDSSYFQADRRFSTSHDYKIARILANDEIKIYLEAQINTLNSSNKSISNTTSKSMQKLTWTAPKVALVELIYALHTEKVFQNGSIDLKEIISHFESTFDIELGQFHRVYLEIRSRKTERTKFLNALREKLTLKMEQADS